MKHYILDETVVYSWKRKVGLEGQLISEHTILNLLIKKSTIALAFDKLCTPIEFPGIFNLET